MKLKRFTAPVMAIIILFSFVSLVSANLNEAERLYNQGNYQDAILEYSKASQFYQSMRTRHIDNIEMYIRHTLYLAGIYERIGDSYIQMNNMTSAALNYQTSLAYIEQANRSITGALARNYDTSEAMSRLNQKIRDINIGINNSLNANPNRPPSNNNSNRANTPNSRVEANNNAVNRNNHTNNRVNEDIEDILNLGEETDLETELRELDFLEGGLISFPEQSNDSNTSRTRETNNSRRSVNTTTTTTITSRSGMLDFLSEEAEINENQVTGFSENVELGDLYYDQGDNQKALDYYLDCLALRNNQTSNLELIKVNHRIGSIYQQQGKLQEALDYLDRSLALSKQVGETEILGMTYFKIANILRERGDYQRAISLFEDSLRINMDIPNRDNIIGQTYFNLGLLYDSAGKYPSALQNYENCIKINQQINEMQGVGVSYYYVGNIYERMGELEMAMEYYQLALQILDSINSPDAQAVKDGISALERRM